MILYFNKVGQLLEQLDYGTKPRAGSNKFQIFAYFEGLTYADYGTALIKLKRPDINGSEYPLLFMTAAEITIDDTIETLPMDSKFENGKTYQGFVFNFNFSDAESTPVILLDTPGMWEATITLVNEENSSLNIVGLVKFFVESSVTSSDDEPAELDYDTLMINIALGMESYVHEFVTDYVNEEFQLVEIETIPSDISDTLKAHIIAHPERIIFKYGNDLYRYKSVSSGVYSYSVLKLIPNETTFIVEDAILTIDTTTETATVSGALSGDYETYKKSKVDTELGKKVDKIESSDFVYATDSSGDPIALPYADYVEAGSLVTYDINGDVIIPNTPTSENGATSKKYVDAIDNSFEVFELSKNGGTLTSNQLTKLNAHPERIVVKVNYSQGAYEELQFSYMYSPSIIYSKDYIDSRELGLYLKRYAILINNTTGNYIFEYSNNQIYRKSDVDELKGTKLYKHEIEGITDAGNNSYILVGYSDSSTAITNLSVVYSLPTISPYIKRAGQGDYTPIFPGYYPVGSPNMSSGNSFKVVYIDSSGNNQVVTFTCGTIIDTVTPL